jgi:hypothetical protein
MAFELAKVKLSKLEKGKPYPEFIILEFMPDYSLDGPLADGDRVLNEQEIAECPDIPDWEKENREFKREEDRERYMVLATDEYFMEIIPVGATSFGYYSSCFQADLDNVGTEEALGETYEEILEYAKKRLGNAKADTDFMWCNCPTIHFVALLDFWSEYDYSGEYDSGYVFRGELDVRQANTILRPVSFQI